MTSPAIGTYPPSTTRKAAKSGRIGLWLAVAAAVGSLLASGIVGATVGPMQLENGPLLADSGPAYTTLVLVLLGSQLLWTGLGVAALVLGILGLRRGPGHTPSNRGAGVAAIVVALAAPVLSFAVFMVLVLLSVAD